MNPPRISIAMATCNGARFLREQLDSLEQQELRPFELQIGDDGSTDASEQIVREFADRAPFPVHFHRNEAALGYGENFIQTARRCTGDWIAFCDQDDVWKPSKLRRCAEELGRWETPIDLIVHDAQIVDEQLRPAGLLYGIRTAAVHPPLTLAPEWYALGLTQVFRASLLADLPCNRRVSFPWHAHRQAHDVWISLIANMAGSISLIPDALVSYRRHGGTATTTNATEASPLRMLSSHGSDFGARADYLEEVATTLEYCAGAAQPRLRAQLEAAIGKVRYQAGLLRLRTEAYQNLRLERRSLAFWRLVRSGGYVGRRGWPFGLARGAKDFVFMLAGPSSSR